MHAAPNHLEAFAGSDTVVRAAEQANDASSIDH